MKIKILREKIKKAVSCAEKVAGKDMTLPILSNIMIVGKKNYLSVIATNLETSVSWDILAKIEEDGAGVLPTSVFLGLINSLTGSSLAIENDKNAVYIIDGKTKAGINIIPADDFPLPSTVGEGEYFVVNGAEFCRLLARVASFTASSSIKPEINGVCLIFSGDFVKAVSTDSFRLGEAVLVTSKQTAITKNQTVILPARAVREIIAIFGDVQKNINIYIDKNQITAELIDDSDADQPKIRFTSRLIEGDFPDYQAIIPSSYVSTAVFNRKDVLNQLKSAMMFSGKNGEAVFLISPQNNTIKISSQSADLGKYEGEADLKKISGKDMKIVFNCRFLIEGLSAIGGDDCVFEFSQDDGPAVLKSNENNDFMYLIMPIKN